MNEATISKLHQLADQCKDQHNTHRGPWMNYIQFAELVVQECVATMNKTLETQLDGEDEKFGCICAIMDVQEHFGVEE